MVQTPSLRARGRLLGTRAPVAETLSACSQSGGAQRREGAPPSRFTGGHAEARTVRQAGSEGLPGARSAPSAGGAAARGTDVEQTRS